MKPRLLDLFCGAGGCSVGYARAGFQVVGVDNDERALRRYPFPAIRADAMEVLAGGVIDLDAFDVIHASPPCQAYSIATRNSATADHAGHVARTGHMLPDTLAALTEQHGDRPWVVENVPGSDAHIYTAPWVITMCGAQHRITTAQGYRLRLKRHRLFASNVFLLAEPCSCDGRAVTSVTGTGSGTHNSTGRRPVVAPVSGHGAPGRLTASVVGHGSTHDTHSVANGGVLFSADEARRLMGCEWMTRDQVAQAIPPAYTEHIGAQLIDHLRHTAGA